MILYIEENFSSDTLRLTRQRNIRLMIKISTDIRLAFPRSLVFTTYRDKLDELVPYMPNVRAVEEVSRQAQNGHILLVHEWHGGGDIPAAAKALLSEQMLSWTEYNNWDESTYTLTWKNQTHAFTEAVDCAGKNTFREENGFTIIECRGELKIDAHKIHGVPFFLTNQVAHLVEDYLSKKIEPNLLQMSEGVRQYLEHHAGKA